MNRLKELEKEKKELLEYKKFLCNLKEEYSLEEAEKTNDKPKVKKRGVR